MGVASSFMEAMSATGDIRWQKPQQAADMKLVSGPLSQRQAFPDPPHCSLAAAAVVAWLGSAAANRSGLAVAAGANSVNRSLTMRG